MRGRWAGVFLITALCLVHLPHSAAALEEDAALCLTEISRQEAALGIPSGLLAAISLVESGRRGQDGQRRPWPWTLNINGQGAFYADQTSARQSLGQAMTGGRRQVDVGCMQVNLQAHGEAFASLTEALDPARNVAYAASFLVALHQETGSWERATAYYHSRTPSLGSAYRQRVDAARSGAGTLLAAYPPEAIPSRTALVDEYLSYQQRRLARAERGDDGTAPPQEAQDILVALQENRRSYDVVRRAYRDVRR